MVSHRTTSDTSDQDHLEEDCCWNPCSNPAHNSPLTATTTASCNHAPAPRSLCHDILEMDQPSPQRLHLHLAESFDGSSVDARPVLHRPMPDHGSAPGITTNPNLILSRPGERSRQMRQPLLPTLQPTLAERSGSSSINTRPVVGRFDPALASTRIVTTSGIHPSRPVSNGTLETRQAVSQPLQSDVAGVSGNSSMNGGVVVRRLESLHISATMETTITRHAPRSLDNDALGARQSSPQSLQPNLTEGPSISSGQHALLECLNAIQMGATAVYRDAGGLRTPIAEAREIVTGAEGSTLLAGQHIQRLRQDLSAVPLHRSTVANPRLQLTNPRVSRDQTAARRTTGSSRNRPPSGESSRASHLTLPARYRSGLTHTPADIVNDRALPTSRQQHALNRDENNDAALYSPVSTEDTLSMPASDPLAASLGGLPRDVPPSSGLVDAIRNLDVRIRSPLDSETGYPVRSESASASGEEEESVDDQ